MERRYITVTTLNKYLKNKFDTDPNIQTLFLKGEISNFKGHTRGHLYFTLKDEGSRINAVMFSNNANKLTFVPQDGMKVLVVGRVSIYEPNGGYQIYINEMQEDGLGNLYLKFEELKKKLSNEGLFLESHKKKIPKFPKRIGIITAPTGAAIKDILSTIKRRFPSVETILFPTLVQGELAKDNIVKQISVADSYDLDLIIVGRGGGSIEDLWCFNEEIVARAIYNAKTPIISAVGHEIDFTIADFVSDLRAPTPTGAAEMAVPNIIDVNNYINQINIRLNSNINTILTNYKNRIDTLKTTYVLSNPLASYEVHEQKLDSLINDINVRIKHILDNNKKRFDMIKSNYVLNNPDSFIGIFNNNYELLLNKLNLLNPLNVLSKGYSVVKKDGKTISNVRNIKQNDKIDIKLYKGNIKAIVEGVEK